MLESLMQSAGVVLEEGVIVMIAGMGVVFSFLAIMVVAMNIMGTIIAKLNVMFPPKVLEAAPSRKPAAAGGVDEIAVAIAAVLNKR